MPAGVHVLLGLLMVTVHLSVTVPAAQQTMHLYSVMECDVTDRECLQVALVFLQVVIQVKNTNRTYSITCGTDNTAHQGLVRLKTEYKAAY